MTNIVSGVLTNLVCGHNTIYDLDDMVVDLERGLKELISMDNEELEKQAQDPDYDVEALEKRIEALEERIEETTESLSELVTTIRVGYGAMVAHPESKMWTRTFNYECCGRGDDYRIKPEIFDHLARRASPAEFNDFLLNTYDIEERLEHLKSEHDPQ